MSETKREIGFAATVLGFGISLLFALFYVTRRGPGSDPSLDGVEQFAEGLGYGFQSEVIKFCGTVAMVACGGIGFALGSRLGKTLFVAGLCGTIWIVSVVLYRIFSH